MKPSVAFIILFTSLFAHTSRASVVRVITKEKVVAENILSFHVTGVRDTDCSFFNSNNTSLDNFKNSNVMRRCHALTQNGKRVAYLVTSGGEIDTGAYVYIPARNITVEFGLASDGAEAVRQVDNYASAEAPSIFVLDIGPRARVVKVEVTALHLTNKK
jgi:hypothetical protein